MFDVILPRISQLAGVVIAVSAACWMAQAAWRAWRERNHGQLETYTWKPTGQKFLVNRAGGIVELKEDAK